MTFRETREICKKMFRVFLSARTPYFSKPFICALIVSTIIIFASFTYGASRGNQIEIEVADQTVTEVEKMAREASWVSIFINNVSMALMTLIPILGAAWMIYVQFNTGWYLGAMAKAYHIDYIMATSLILTSIVGLIEYPAYIVVLGESLILVYSAMQGGFKERLIQHSWKSIIIVISLLLLGGVVEASLLGNL